MPWLVPACSQQDLKKTREAGAVVFEGANIACLVPGVRKSAFDARAYLWEDSMLECVFEFKARSGDYTLKTACGELKRKCGDNTNSHAMLLGTTGNATTEARVWLDDVDKLRIVLVVGNKLAFDPEVALSVVYEKLGRPVRSVLKTSTIFSS
jgi:hypothetical protein